MEGRITRITALFLVDDYLPLSTKNHAKMMHELALKFQSFNHKVIILTPGTICQNKFLVADSIDGVIVWRFRAFTIRGKGRLFRAFFEICMPVFALIAIVLSRNTREFDFEIVVNYSPSIFFGPVAHYFKMRGSFVFLVLRDFFPKWAVDEGLLKDKSIVTRFFRQVERFNYRSSNVIGVQSSANLDVFKAIYSDYVDLKVLMNWSEQTPYEFEDGDDPHSLRKKLNIPLHKVIIFYGGNIGCAQDMSNIIRLARGLRSNKDSHILLVGNGDEYELVSNEKARFQIENLTLLPSVSQENYKKYLACADIGLFSLSQKHASHNFPGKLLGYMVEGKPILGSVNLGNDVASIISDSRSGFVSFNGDDSQFLADALSLIDSVSLRKMMGLNSNLLLKSTFSVDKAYEIINESYLAFYR